MLISIIVPFYNVEPYFRRCLDSIINQTYRNLEIILVNDCSPDNCIAIAREYAAKDDRIVIIEHEQSTHVGGARNSGLAIAKGEYIWFIDSDDEISSAYAVEHLVTIAQRDMADIVLFDAQILDNHKKVLGYLRYSYAIEQVFNEDRLFYPVLFDAVIYNNYENCFFTPAFWSKFLRKEFLREHNFSFLEHTIHQDIVSVMLLLLAKRVTQAPHIFYNYYIRENSTTTGKLPADYIKHFERIASQLNMMKWGEWTKKPHADAIIPCVLLYHISYNTNRIYTSLTPIEQHRWLVDVYHFLQQQLSEYIPLLLNLEPIPVMLSNHPQAWKALFNSFTTQAHNRHENALVRGAILGDNVSNKKNNPIKKIIKMFLPYGVIRYAQIQKKKRGKD